MGSWSEALGPFILILFVDLTLHAIVHADASHSATAFCLQPSHGQIRSGISSGHRCKRSRPRISGLRMEKDLEGFDEWYKSVKEGQREKPRTDSLSTSRRAPLHAEGDTIVFEKDLSATVGRPMLPSGLSSGWDTFEGAMNDGRTVEIKAVSLKRMGGEWGTLDEMQAGGRSQRVAAGQPGVPAFVGNFEVDAEGDRLYYTVCELPKPLTPLSQVIEGGWRPTEDDVFDIAEGLLMIIDSLESLRPPLLHGAITPSSVLVSRKQDAPSPPGGAILAGKWHVSLRKFGAGEGGGDVRGASWVMLYMLTGKGEEDFEWGRDGSATFLRQVAASRPMRLLMQGLLDSGSPRAPSASLALESLWQARKQASTRDGATALSTTPLTSRIRKPEGTRVTLSRTGGEALSVEIPKAGVTGDTVSTGAFTAAWTAGIGFWTASAITGGAPILFTAFSIPFWLAGGSLAKKTVYGAAASEALTIDENLYSVKQVAFGKEIGGGAGDRDDLVDCGIVTTGYVNSRPVRCIKFRTRGSTDRDFGMSLSESEVQWICSEVRDFLGLPPMAFPPPDPMPPQRDAIDGRRDTW